MKERDQWICWLHIDTPNGKINKIPTDPRTGHNINAMDPRSWLSYESSLQFVASWNTDSLRGKLGVGFVFTKEDPFFFVDLDECANPGGPNPWQPHVEGVLRQFPGAAVEVSCSGRGLHIFGCSTRGLRHSNKCKELRAELYTQDRFVALGTGVNGDAYLDFTPHLTQFIADHFPPADDGDALWTDAPRADYTGAWDDDELIRRASLQRSAAAAFGGSASFADLWANKEVVLGQCYPSSSGDTYDRSSADMALVSHLAYWTGADCERMRRLMFRSELRRGKWDREQWLRNTILRGASTCKKVYDHKGGDKEPPREPGSLDPRAHPTAEGVTLRTGYQYMPCDRQVRHFEGYCYVKTVDRVLSPEGMLFDASRLQATRGGYEFALDDQPNGRTSKRAWEVFTSSQSIDYTIADALTFEPGNTAALIQHGRFKCANTWRDPKPRRVKGDSSTFINHIQKLWPVDDDAEIMLAYLAAAVQHQGKKFTWAPIIQGVQGNGKSTLADALSHAIGHELVHVMKGESLASQFNGWLASSTVAVIEDLLIRGSSTIESIKPMITSTRLQIERKGIDQTTERVCCNFIFTTNHKDGIRLDPDERRFAMFYCAQQRKSDLFDQGINGAYFERLYQWLERKDGYAIVADYLATYQIPDKWNPATKCMRAPETSSHEDALEASLCVEAQILAEAIAAEEPGFAGGWVSTRRANDLLESKRKGLGPRRLASVIESLGYIKHPNLRDGQASRPIGGEGRPRLWVKPWHLSIELEHRSVVIAYEKAQGIPGPTIAHSVRP